LFEWESQEEFVVCYSFLERMGDKGSHMKIPSRLFVVPIAALFLAQIVAFASGQNANPLDTPPIQKKRQPKPQPDNSSVKLPSFSLDIKAEKTTAKVGERFKVEVNITNTDSQDIFYDGYGHQAEFELEVRDEMGREVTRVPRGGRWTSGSSAPIPLHPGESLHLSTRLDKEFELDKPGKYSVQATRGVSKTNLVSSNTITITIIP
jgi:hypothetical protein